MFDASLCPADVLQRMADLCSQLVAAQVEMLRRLGHARDIELLFADGYCRPDWGLADCLDEEAQRIVREIFDRAHDVERAEDELELRALPN
jgi:hypothetical protein